MTTHVMKKPVRLPPRARRTLRRAASRGSPAVGTSRRKTRLSKRGCHCSSSPTRTSSAPVSLPRLMSWTSCSSSYVLTFRFFCTRYVTGPAGGGVAGGRLWSTSAEKTGEGALEARPEWDKDRWCARSAASSEARSSVRSKRREGSFWRQRETSASKDGGMPCRTRLSGPGSLSITAAST